MTGHRARPRRMGAALIAAASVLLAAAAFWGAHRSSTTSPSAAPGGDTARHSHVLLITVDTLRADHVGAYGFARARTFTMDGLAQEGVRVERAISAAPITLPSHATILSGLYPPAHGVRDNSNYRAPDELTLLSERLASVGYETRAFVSAVVLARRYNLSQGFEVYDDDLWSEDDPPMFMIRERTADKTVDRVLAWLDDRQSRGEERPFFAWMHLFDPHQPYTAPAAERMLSASAYDGDIAFADRHLGRLVRSMKERGLLDDTLVVLTSDHGESLGEHGEKTHAVFIYDATTRVPLILRYPPLFTPGTVYRGPVRTVDITPTVLGVLGLPLGDMQGRDLHRALTGAEDPPQLTQYSESLLSEVGFGMAPLFGLRDGNDTYIRAPRRELYDRGSDPGEIHNLLDPTGDAAAREHAEPRAATLDRALDAVLAASAQYGLAADDLPFDPDAEAALRALGYVGDTHTAEAVQGMDPKDGIRIHGMLEDARQMVRDERPQEGLVLVRAILEEVPANVSALNLLGFAQRRLGDLAAAEAAYRQALAAFPNQPRDHLALAQIRVEREDLVGAQQQLEDALRVSPDYAEAILYMGFIHHLRGDEDEAARWYRRAAEADEHFPKAHSFLGDLYFRRGEYSEALAAYRRALDRLPSYYAATLQAGVSAKRLADRATADAYFERAAELRRDAWAPHYNLACTAALAGEAEGALAHLAEAARRGLDNPELVRRDADFAALRGQPELERLLAEIGRREAPSERSGHDAETP